jgi:hypothetical protein
MSIHRASALLLLILILGLGTAQRSVHSQDAPSSTVQQAATPSTDKDEQKKDLELQKLRSEIAKLSAESAKLRADSFWSWTAPIASIVGILTLPILAWTISSQRKTALEVQKQEGEHELVVKIADFVMGSRSPEHALKRAELLTALYKGQAANEFLNLVKSKAAEKDFPGDIGIEMRKIVFDKLASNYKEPAEMVELARRIWPNDGWLKKLDVPKKTA